MRILQVNVIYGHGSTGKIVETLHKQYLSLGHESYVLFGRGKRSKDPNVRRTGFLWEAKLWRFIQLFTGNFLGGSPLSTWNLKRHIRRIHPDVVHLHCVNGNMCNVFSLLKWLKKYGYKTVLTHHAKFMFTGGCGLNLCEGFATGCGNCPHKKEVFGRFCGDKSAKNVKRLSDLDLSGAWIQHAYVSPWLRQQAEKSALLKNAHNHVVYNPVDLRLEAVTAKKPYVFFPISLKADYKGWNFIEPLGKKLKELGVDLYVTGSGQEAFNSSNIKDVGRINNKNDLARCYAEAIATVILSRCESFSMPVIESLLCGTPVVGFKAGAPETLDVFGCASFYEYGNLDLVASRAKELLQNPINIDTRKLVALYGSAAVADRYIEIYQRN